MNLFSAFSTDVAIDLGTANTCVFARGRGIVLNEPSIVAFNTAKGSIEAVGIEAHEMLGRTPANIKPVRPMKDGVIADFDAAEKMLMYFVRKAQGRRLLRRPRLVIGVPPEITQVERRAVKDSGYRVKASEVHLVDEPMAAAIGSGLPVTEAAGNMIIDIGGGTTDIAVISLAGTVYGRSLRVAGNALDEAIMSYLRRTHNLLIGERTAEQIKCEVGSAAPLNQPLSMEVKGRHLLEGVPRTVMITDAEVRESMAEPIRIIVAAVRDALERIPPELCADIYDRGVVLTGGGALLRNLDKRLREETGLPVMVAENPLTSVVLGAGKMLTDLALLRRVTND
jgi:rod shape-determining protein MreB